MQPNARDSTSLGMLDLNINELRYSFLCTRSMFDMTNCEFSSCLLILSSEKVGTTFMIVLSGSPATTEFKCRLLLLQLHFTYYLGQNISCPLSIASSSYNIDVERTSLHS